MKLVLGRAIVMVGLGLGIGLAGALGGARLIRQLLYETPPADLLTLLAVSVGLAVVCFAACAAPAWRACRIDPVRALRTQ
jgi:putative ABC transport system permease protein